MDEGARGRWRKIVTKQTSPGVGGAMEAAPVRFVEGGPSRGRECENIQGAPTESTGNPRKD